jgi:hypothetical protein
LSSFLAIAVNANVAVAVRFLASFYRCSPLPMSMPFFVLAVILNKAKDPEALP